MNISEPRHFIYLHFLLSDAVVIKAEKLFNESFYEH